MSCHLVVYSVLSMVISEAVVSRPLELAGCWRVTGDCRIDDESYRVGL